MPNLGGTCVKFASIALCVQEDSTYLIYTSKRTGLIAVIGDDTLESAQIELLVLDILIMVVLRISFFFIQ